jgi:hypothetical protein
MCKLPAKQLLDMLGEVLAKQQPAKEEETVGLSGVQELQGAARRKEEGCCPGRKGRRWYPGNAGTEIPTGMSVTETCW